MSGLLRASVGLVVGLALLLSGSELLAQPGPPLPPAYTPLAPGEAKPSEADAAKKPVVVLPKLKRFVEATYPQEAVDQGLAATVEIELVVAPDGTVKDAHVVTPQGHGFDEAALEAVRKFEFEPATKDGQPLAARIRYPYVFELKPPPEPEPQPEAPPPPGRLEGQILAGESQQPIVGAEVSVTGPDGAVSHQTTDATGHFAIDGLAAGSYDVQVQTKDREPSQQQEELRSGEATSVIYRLAKPPDKEAFSATARIQAPPREVTRRTIGKEEMTRIPGTRGDALRTIELMPGVGRPPLGAGIVLVRGSAPFDTQIEFEGLPVQLLYHFGGLTSFMNSRMIQSIDLYPGNFSVRYGRRRGGVIDIRAADLPHEVHAVADINLIDSSLLLQAPIGKDAEFALAARKSYLDALFKFATTGSNISTIAAPVYYDYQGILSYRPSDHDKLRLMIFGSYDRLKLVSPQPLDADSTLTGNFNVATQFHRVHASWRRQLSDGVEQDIDFAAGPLDAAVAFFGGLTFKLTGAEIYERSEWRARVNDHVRLIGGLDLFFFPGRLNYAGPPPGQSEGNPSMMDPAFSNRSRVAVNDQLFIAQPAGYVESDIDFHPWRFVLGSRIDYFSEIQGYSYDPRGVVMYALSERTTLKTGAGMFSQPPQLFESSVSLGNSHLHPQHTVHTGLGVDERVGENITVGLEGFYKHMFDRVIGTQFGEPPIFVNGGQGRVYGLELSIKVPPHPEFLNNRFFGYLSYTLMRSERRDHKSDPWSLFDYDQTHILTISALYRLGRGWEAGVTFRLVSGNPITPVAGASLNTGTDQYSPIYGLLNSQRSPTFNRLDARVEKKWTFKDWRLALYLDVQNVTNAVNPEGLAYDYEYRKTQTVRGLPIIPILGLRGEL